MLTSPLVSRQWALCAAFLVLIAAASFNVSAGSLVKPTYDQIRSFQLAGGSVQLTNRVFKRDRVTMTLTGTIYFSAPINGKVTGAVFIGQGNLRAEVPESTFEKANVRRMLKADVVDSDFTSAVFRFTDDTFELLGGGSQSGSVPPEAQKLASEIDARVLKQTGANLSSRLMLSIINAELPGVFFAHFDGGKLGDFSFLFDPQTRVPTANFDLNGGEKGLIFRYNKILMENDVLMGFYSLSDYQRRMVEYSDMNDLVDISHYDMDVDLRSPRSKLGLNCKITMKARTDGVRVIPFSVGESLDEAEDQRLKKQLHILSVKYAEAEVETMQENWEGGFAVVLPAPLAAGQEITLEMRLEGDFLRQAQVGISDDFSYPRSNTDWYPRHGFLDRSTYSLTFTHQKKHKVACVGTRVSEGPTAEDKDTYVTKFRMDYPVALVTFASGLFERHTDTIKWDGTDKVTPLEFNSVSGSYQSIKEDFLLAELNNSVRFFKQLFGDYPYETYSATFHPFSFGQGFPTMLMIPATDRDNKYTFSFISHETAHQWWGNIVSWRSYRDQWLSEGFAEYSGVLYTRFRQNYKAADHLVDEMRASLRQTPETVNGVGKGKLNDIGPIILGNRLSSSKSLGGYQTLVYNKGALVLRMLHFLLTDPATGNGQPFFDMMKDFVERYRNKTASTDDFRRVASEHFARSPIAKKYNLTDLNWFFQQWVYETGLPSYTLEYQIEDGPNGTAVLSGNILQENVSENFLMPLPLSLKFGGDKAAVGTIAALGAKTPFRINLPMRPTKVELDPNDWVLSEKTTTK
jgi:hypothetical protein